MSLAELQEVLTYEEAVSMLAFAGVCVCVHIFSDILVWIGKKIHCHRIMKSGKKHKCHYWTCEYYYVCPYNSCDIKLPKKFKEC